MSGYQSVTYWVSDRCLRRAFRLGISDVAPIPAELWDWDNRSMPDDPPFPANGRVRGERRARCLRRGVLSVVL